jgi:hypothetical protein
MQLTAPVECGKYFKADRGTLTLASGNLRFESDGRCVFDVPLPSIEKIVWHWYSFSAAFEATIARQNYFLSFIPRMAGFHEWWAALMTGRRWRAAMEGNAAPGSMPLAARLFRVSLQVAQIFIMGCAAILSWGMAMAPDASTLSLLLGLLGAVAAGLGFIALIGRGLIEIAAAFSRHTD